MRVICSKCHQGIMKCMCENFHPSVLTGISRTLAEKLLEHYDSIGWISYEDYPEVHQFIKELNNFTKDR